MPSRSLSYLKIMQGEPQLILSKDNARREQNEINVFISYAEPQLILSKPVGGIRLAHT